MRRRSQDACRATRGTRRSFARRFALVCESGRRCSQVIVKAVPPVSTKGRALTLPPVAMVILSGVQVPIAVPLASPRL